MIMTSSAKLDQQKNALMLFKIFSLPAALKAFPNLNPLFTLWFHVATLSQF